MNKRYIALGVVIVIAIAGGVIFATNRTDKTESSVVPTQDDQPKQLNLRFSDVIASYPHDPKACLATSHDSNLELTAEDKEDIENAVMLTIVDVPAGTNVDIYVDTYDGTNATGTSIYESTFGSYNFIAKKIKQDRNSDHESWAAIDLAACKK